MLLSKRVFSVLFSFLAVAQATSQTMKPLKIEGRTMGTTYSVTYFDKHERDFGLAIDSILKVVNKGINNYDLLSDVSSFNKSEKGGKRYSVHFEQLVKESLRIARESDGNFDPTVMPLVNLWGFGPHKGEIPTRHKIDSIKDFVGHHHIAMNGTEVSKDRADTQLDFGGIGQGYGVDVICNFLRSRGVRNFLVELGGEGFASGENLERGAKWKVGLINPLLPKDEQELMGYALVKDEAFTTSGNYFNYRVIDGKKYGHTISPFSGFPVEHTLISVSLFAKDCTTADGWDTAFLVGGKEQSLGFLTEHPELDAMLVYMVDDKPRVFISEKLKNKIFIDSSYDH
jgi:FAD:protein FMN transferase